MTITITTTSVAFILLSFGLVSCGVWLFKSFQKDGGVREYGRVGYLLSLLLLGFGFKNGIMGFGALFFAKNSEMLYFVLIASHLFLGIITLLGVYTIYNIFSHRIASYLGMVLAGILGIGLVATTIATHPRPFITPQNGIEWNMNFPLSLLVFCLLFISIGSILYIFIRVFFVTETRSVKIFSFSLSVLALAGIVLVFMQLILPHSDVITVGTQIFDFGIMVGSILFIIVLLIVPIINNIIQNRKEKAFNLSKKL